MSSKNKKRPPSDFMMNNLLGKPPTGNKFILGKNKITDTGGLEDNTETLKKDDDGVESSTVVNGAGVSAVENNEDGKGSLLIPLNKIIPNPNQPRTQFNQKKLEELAASIKRHGVVQPIILTPTENDEYMIVAGERRWRASSMAGLVEIPAVVREGLTESDIRAISLIENIQRENLNLYDRAVSMRDLWLELSKPSLEVMGEILGFNKARISQIFNIFKLPKDIMEVFKDSRLNEKHLRALNKLKFDKELMRKFLDNILQSNYSGDEALNVADTRLDEYKEKITFLAKIKQDSRKQLNNLEKSWGQLPVHLRQAHIEELVKYRDDLNDYISKFATIK